MREDDNDDERPQGPPPEWFAERAAYRAAHPSPDPEPEPEVPVPLKPEELRQRSAEHLLRQLDSVTELATHCERLSGIPTQDRIAPIIAAARLLTASAHVATALARVTSTESRQRKIIERVQTVVTQKPDLNSNLDAASQNGPPYLAQQAAAALDGLLFDTLQRKMLLYMNQIGRASCRERV